MPDYPIPAQLQQAAPRIGGPTQRAGLNGSVADQGGGATQHRHLWPARQMALPVLLVLVVVELVLLLIMILILLLWLLLLVV